MMRTLSRFTLVILALCVAAKAEPEAPCEAAEGERLVYGDDWSFVSETPRGWVSACHVVPGANIVLWPKKEKDPAENFIYVTVNTKEGMTLDQFIAHEVSRFREGAPRTVVTPVRHSPSAARGKSRVVHVVNPDRSRHEYMAYVEMPKRFYLIVLTTSSPGSLEKYRPQFEAYLKAFAPRTNPKKHD